MKLSLNYDLKMAIAAEAIAKGFINSSSKIDYEDTLEEVVINYNKIKRIRKRLLRNRRMDRKVNYKMSSMIGRYYTHYAEILLEIMKGIKDNNEESILVLLGNVYVALETTVAYLDIENEIDQENEDILLTASNTKQMISAIKMLLYKYSFDQIKEPSKEEKNLMDETIRLIAMWPSEEEIINDIVEFVLEFLDFFLKTVKYEFENTLVDIEKINKIFSLNINSDLKEKLFLKRVTK